MTAPSVVVVGGGATGTGIARDLAARGLDVTLIERGGLAAGTTGHTHGLLHSGARYAVSDPESARACIEENRILAEIAPHCIEPCGGLFVEHPDDPDGYVERKLDACRDCGVPAEVVSGETAREREPALSGAIERAIRVPDGVLRPGRLCVANAVAAERAGARIEVGARVTDLVTEGDRVRGVEVERDDTSAVEADHVVNAAGPWAGRIGDLAGVDVDLRLSKGAMTVVGFGGLDSVINRCRPRGEGDIAVPRPDAAVLGTTDAEVDDPERFPTDGDAAGFLVDELSTVVPPLADAAVERTYWGVRPLYAPGDAADSTGVTRDFAVLDHGARDGLAGFTSVVGGKLTTYRLMAERAADAVCDRLGVGAACRTAEVPLPGRDDPDALDARFPTYGVDAPAPE